MDDLRLLPKFRDSLSYLYVEHCRVDREKSAILLYEKAGVTQVPAASLAMLMLGPGTRITHAAMLLLAENNCLAVWCGEQGVRFYACGVGGTRSAAGLLHQARLVSDANKRLEVAVRMYQHRFREAAPPAFSLEQLRGWEGRRVREAYSRASRDTGLPWEGRSYDRSDWRAADPVSRALSSANSCLYGLCHAAILSLGFSAALGFIHTGKQLSFVYDVADLYKTAVSIPVAFRTAAEGSFDLERRARLACRDLFREYRLLEEIANDIPQVLGLRRDDPEAFATMDFDPAVPGYLWDPDRTVPAGVAYGWDSEEGDDGDRSG